MIYTNNHKLPAIVARALQRDDHKQDGKYSVSELCDPPQMTFIKRKHGNKIVKDVSDNLAAWIGTAIHAEIARNGSAEDLIEQHLCIEIGGIKISGTPDRFGLKDRILDDWKYTAMYNYKKGGGDDWEAKLNIYAFMIGEVLGIYPIKLQDHFLIRDWQRREAKYTAGYPQILFQTIEQPLWSKNIVKQYIMERLELHEKAGLAFKEADLPPCNDEEMWKKGDVWAVKASPTASRARKNFTGPTALVEATAFAKPGDHLEHRPGGYTRCDDWCDAKPWCAQIKRRQEK